MTTISSFVIQDIAGFNAPTGASDRKAKLRQEQKGGDESRGEGQDFHSNVVAVCRVYNDGNKPALISAQPSFLQCHSSLKRSHGFQMARLGV